MKNVKKQLASWLCLVALVVGASWVGGASPARAADVIYVKLAPSPYFQKAEVTVTTSSGSETFEPSYIEKTFPLGSKVSMTIVAKPYKVFPNLAGGDVGPLDFAYSVTDSDQGSYLTYTLTDFEPGTPENPSRTVYVSTNTTYEFGASAFDLRGGSWPAKWPNGDDFVPQSILNFPRGTGSYIVPGKTVPKPPDPVRNGYKFIGWSGLSRITEPYKTFTRGNFYQFDEVSRNIYQKDVKGEGPAARANQAAKEKNEPQNWAYQFILVPLVAEWDALLSFDANGGKGTMDPVTFDKVKNKAPKPQFTNDGMVFTGWRGTNGVSYQVGDVLPTGSPLKLVAQWDKIKPIATFNFLRDSVNPEAVTKTADNNGNVVTPLETGYPRDGFRLTGWKAPNGEVTAPGSVVTITEPTSFDAVWTPLVTFDLAGGQGDFPLSQLREEGLVAPSPTKQGYSFQGWKNPNAPDDELIKGGEMIPTGTDPLALQAQWARVVTVVSSNGVGSEPTREVRGAAPGNLAPSALERPGYQFLRWIGSDGKSYEPEVSPLPDGDITLFAEWEPVDKPVPTVTATETVTATATATTTVTAPTATVTITVPDSSASASAVPSATPSMDPSLQPCEPAPTVTVTEEPRKQRRLPATGSQGPAVPEGYQPATVLGFTRRRK